MCNGFASWCIFWCGLDVRLSRNLSQRLGLPPSTGTTKIFRVLGRPLIVMTVMTTVILPRVIEVGFLVKMLFLPLGKQLAKVPEW